MPDFAGYVRQYPQFSFWDKAPREESITFDTLGQDQLTDVPDDPVYRTLIVSPVDPGVTTEDVRIAIRGAMERSGMDPGALVSVGRVDIQGRCVSLELRSFHDTNRIMRLSEKPHLDGRALLLQRPHSFRPPAGIEAIMNNAVTTGTDCTDSEPPRLLFRVNPNISAEAVRALAERYGVPRDVFVARRKADVAVAVVDFSSTTDTLAHVGEGMLEALSRISPGCTMRQQRRHAQMRSSGSDALTPVPAWITRLLSAYNERAAPAGEDPLDPGTSFERALSNRVRVFGLLEPADMLDYSESLAAIVAEQARRLLLRFLSLYEPARNLFPPELSQLEADTPGRTVVEHPQLKLLFPESCVTIDMNHLSVDISVQPLGDYHMAARVAAWSLFSLLPTQTFRGQRLVTQFVLCREQLQLPDDLILADKVSDDAGVTRPPVQMDEDDLIQLIFNEIDGQQDTAIPAKSWQSSPYVGIPCSENSFQWQSVPIISNGMQRSGLRTE